MISKHFLVTINLVSNKTDTSSGMSEHIVQKVISNATRCIKRAGHNNLCLLPARKFRH